MLWVIVSWGYRMHNVLLWECGGVMVGAGRDGDLPGRVWLWARLLWVIDGGMVEIFIVRYMAFA